MEVKSPLQDASDPENINCSMLCRCTDCLPSYPSDIEGLELLSEIEDCKALIVMRQQNSSDSQVPQTPLDLLKFIVSFGGPDVFAHIGI